MPWGWFVIEKYSSSVKEIFTIKLAMLYRAEHWAVKSQLECKFGVVEMWIL